MVKEIAQKSEASTVANDDIILEVSLPQLLDLALGAPEIGAVNFNILHNLLQFLLHHINLEDTKIEFRGERADRIKKMVTFLKSGPVPQLNEYNITDATVEVSHQTPKDDSSDANVLTDVLQLLEEGISKATKEFKSQQIDLEKEPEAQITIVEKDIRPKSLTFEEREQSGKQSQQRYQTLEDLLTSSEIIERINDIIKEPTSDVWQFINKRIDANEQNIDKLTATIQDIVKGDAVTVDTSLISTRLDELENKVSKLEKWFTDKQAIIGNLTENIITTTDVDAIKVEKKIKAEVKEAAVERVSADKITSEKPALSENQNVNDTESELQDSMENIKANDAENLKQLGNNNGKVKANDAVNLKQLSEAIKNVETAHDKALNDITERVIELEMEIGYLVEKTANIQGTDKTDPESINKFVVKVQEIETDMEKIGQVMDKLVGDKDKQETNINTLLEQVEFLKTVKVSKDDLENALADKADTQTVNRKVSHDQFNAACDDLARGLEEAINKLSSQESIWQQALDEVQNEIATKLDRDELIPLKNFVNDKLKSLQEKLKLIIEARQEVEAAGTKKVLRGVQCISCEKDAVMKTEATNKFRGHELPCTISLKPYLTYELDKVRKQQRILPQSKNMIHLETMMQEITNKVKKEIFAKTPKNYLYNRCCGESQTITTSQEKVIKDGQMYRSRISDKKSCESQSSEEMIPSECTSTTPRNFLCRRNSVNNQTQNSKNKQSKLSELKKKLTTH